MNDVLDYLLSHSVPLDAAVPFPGDTSLSWRPFFYLPLVQCGYMKMNGNHYIVVKKIRIGDCDWKFHQITQNVTVFNNELVLY